MPTPSADTIVQLITESIAHHSSTNLDIITQAENVDWDWFAPAFSRVAAIVRDAQIDYMAGVSIYTGQEDADAEGTRATIDVVVVTANLVVSCSVVAGRNLVAESKVVAWPRTSIVTVEVTGAQLARSSGGDGQGRKAGASAELTFASGGKVTLPPKNSIRRVDADVYELLPRLLLIP